MSQEHAHPYVGYEYKEICVPNRDASLFLDCYASFGWNVDDNRPMVSGGKTTTLYLKRDRKIINKMELTRLQRNFEACIREITILKRSQFQVAKLWAIVVGLLGTAFMAGAVFAVTSQPPGYLLMGLLSIPGFAGWVAPYFLYRFQLGRQSRKVQPMIEDKYEEICQLCEKGHALL